MKKTELVAVFEQVRDLPYHLPLHADESANDAATKHVLLAEKFQKLGAECRLRHGIFSWDDLPLPPSVWSLPHDELATHTFLEIKINGTWCPVDATWDTDLAPLFKANMWDGESSTRLAVSTREVFSPDSPAPAAPDMAHHSAFYSELDRWLDSIRH